MPRLRQPTNVLSLKGSFKTHADRGRARAKEPEAEGEIGDPPARLTDEEKKAWLELVEMAYVGVLCRNDRAFMEYAAKVWVEIKQPGCPDPKVGIRFEQIIGRLGMSPADRSRVQQRKSQQRESPLAEFAKA